MGRKSKALTHPHRCEATSAQEEEEGEEEAAEKIPWPRLGPASWRLTLHCLPHADAGEGHDLGRPSVAREEAQVTLALECIPSVNPWTGDGSRPPERCSWTSS